MPRTPGEAFVAGEAPSAPEAEPLRAPLGGVRTARREVWYSPAELVDFVENGAEPLHWVGPSGEILWANRAELDFLGYAKEEYVGRNIAEFHADAATIADILRRLSAGETLRDYEATLRAKDGSVRHVLITSNVYRENGRFHHTRCFTRDVTERKRLLEAEKESRARAEEYAARAELLYALVGGVVHAEGLEDVFRAAIDAIGAALQTSRASILVFDSAGVMRFRAWRGLSESYRRAVDGHSPWSRDARAPQPILVSDVENDPSMAPYLPLFRDEKIAALAFIPLVAAERLIGKFMVYYERPRQLSRHELEVARAISNHVAAAVERFAAIDELHRAVNFNEMFTAMLGHDLRNPLAGIMAAAQTALRRDEGQALAKPLQRILHSGNRMSRMIDHLLDFSRVRTGSGVPVRFERADLVPLVNQVVEELRDANPEWSIRVRSSGNSEGVWDQDRLCQVLSNLIGNGVQHGIVDHGIDVRIDGTAADVVEFEVHNMGHVPGHLIGTLFEPMTGGQERREKSSGLGLGLFITREIATAHSGTVEVRSSESTGTTFTVRLPRVSGEQGDNQEADRFRSTAP